MQKESLKFMRSNSPKEVQENIDIMTYFLMDGTKATILFGN